MSFMKMIGSISDKLKLSGNAISAVIKENIQYLNAELGVFKEAQEGITALKTYAAIETPSLEAAINSLAETLENIEKARKEKVNQLQEKYIGPLNEIVTEAKIRNTELKEAERAKKALDKAESKLAKLEAKPKEKLKSGQKDEAKAAVKTAQEAYEKEEAEAKAANEAFNKKKLESMRAVLKNLADIEKSFHQKALELMGVVKEKAEAIKVEEEYKILGLNE